MENEYEGDGNKQKDISNEVGIIIKYNDLGDPSEIPKYLEGKQIFFMFEGMSSPPGEKCQVRKCCQVKKGLRNTFYIILIQIFAF